MEPRRDRRAAVMGGFVLLPLVLYVGAYFAAIEPVWFGPYHEGLPCTGPVDTEWGNSFFKQAIEIERESLRHQ